MRTIRLSINVSILISIACLINTANAALKCSDVDTDNPNYIINMERLANEARLTGNYFTRYHEDIVRDLCITKDNDDIEYWIDKGYVNKSEVQGMREILGLDKQHLKGIKYQTIKAKLDYDLGLGSIGSTIVTDYYIDKPESKCAKLTESALQGDPKSIPLLKSFPDYCVSDF